MYPTDLLAHAVWPSAVLVNGIPEYCTRQLVYGTCASWFGSPVDMRIDWRILHIALGSRRAGVLGLRCQLPYYRCASCAQHSSAPMTSLCVQELSASGRGSAAGRRARLGDQAHGVATVGPDARDAGGSQENGDRKHQQRLRNR